MTEMMRTSSRHDDEIHWVPLAAEHLPHFGDILLDSVPAHLHPYLVDAQPQYTQQLRRVLMSPTTHPRHRLRALVTGSDRLAAFVDIRVSATAPETGFLSLLVVFREFRGRGLASSLFRHIAREFAEMRALELDVFADNQPAIRLYDSLGFHRTSTQQWLIRTIPTPPAGNSPVRASLTGSAEAQHARDELAAVGSVRLDPAQTGAGADLRLVGDRVIQTFDIPTFMDTDLLSAVAAVHGGPRTALLITDDPMPPDAPDIHRINTSHRMCLSDLTDLRT